MQYIRDMYDILALEVDENRLSQIQLFRLSFNHSCL